MNAKSLQRGASSKEFFKINNTKHRDKSKQFLEKKIKQFIYSFLFI